MIHLNCARKGKKRELSGIADGLSEGSKRENREIGCIWAALEVVWSSYKICVLKEISKNTNTYNRRSQYMNVLEMCY